MTDLATASPPPCILLLEPSIIIRAEIAEYLRSCGYRVLEASSGGEALTLLKDADLPVDILLAAVDTPGAPDGFATAQWVRSNRPSIDVILAGTPARAAREAGDLCKDGPTLSKPYDHPILLERIKRLLSLRRHTRG